MSKNKTTDTTGIENTVGTTGIENTIEVTVTEEVVPTEEVLEVKYPGHHSRDFSA